MIDLIPYDQWVLWRRVGDRKLPMNPHNGKSASVTDRSTWGSFKEVMTTRTSFQSDGIGFVFSDSDPFVGIDLDDCLIDGEFTTIAQRIITAFDTYTEISPSGCGVKLICRGKIDRGRRTHGIEIYPHERYFTITNHRLPSSTTACNERQSQLDTLVAWIERRTSSQPVQHTLPKGGQTARRSGTSPYGHTALYRELDRLRHTPSGERNNMLNRVAFSLGTLVAAGELDETLTSDMLYDTAIAIGLHPRETRATIRSGMRAGMQRPRRVEPPRKPE